MGDHSSTQTRHTSIPHKLTRNSPKMNKFAVLFAGLVLLSAGAEAGFRCSVGSFLSLFSSSLGDSACSAGCVTLGHTSGICSDDGECNCSERYIDLDALTDLIPSRCSLGEEVCRRTCHAIGRRDGSCVTDNNCECTDETVTAEDFAKCASESTCRIHCQAQGNASGQCVGWSCECSSNNNDVPAIEFDVRSCMMFE